MTGAATLDPDEVRGRLEEIRQQTDLPLGVGFGIDSADAAGKVAKFADAVIAGSALVRIVADNADDREVLVRKASAFVEDLSGAITRARNS